MVKNKGNPLEDNLVNCLCERITGLLMSESRLGCLSTASTW